MKIVEKYSRKRLLRRTAAVRRQVLLRSPEQVRKVLLLWHADDLKAFKYLHNFFKNRSAIVRNLCWTEIKEASGSNVLTIKDINWLGWPREGILGTFISPEFDLLINITTRACFPLEVITALSAASFKAGWDYNESGCYDLSVDVSSRPDSLYLAEQIISFLQSINYKP
ncbi:MAG: hypothetical protein WBK43_08675 [Prolixibacteraceae bacterium]|jgi:hypothetical protein|nr:hypothetical protein [Prolixibacteraceae bacterium]MDI9563760.1 hypothetical protein [Bacteroidota bacterium]NLT00022.1 hypothetical protein [Bacteroidales bacterium]OQB81587.1 MAG: hypothetical protein BWX87_00568 [Bacteroidetes bacterium ADurb.Bin123]HNU77392.1 hypothetical protein [Prolixibacteraceae bacterium]